MKKQSRQMPAATRRSALVYALGPALLSACGGGSSGGDPPAATPPTIVRQPASTTVVVGAPAVFTVEAGAAATSYQWLRDGAEIAGATGASFSYAPASLFESGAVFSVRASNAAGQVTSQGATLAVNSPVLTLIAGLGGAPGYVDGAAGVARFEDPRPIAIDDAGHVYTGARGPTTNTSGARHTIRKIAPDGTVSTFAGLKGEDGLADGVGAAARFREVAAMAFDRNRKVLLVVDAALPDHSPALREATLDAAVTTRQMLATSRAVNAAWGPDGAAYLAIGMPMIGGGLVIPIVGPVAVFKAAPGAAATLLAGNPEVSGLEDGLGAAARFLSVRSLAVDAAHNVYVADGYRLRRIAPDGTVKTLAGSPELSAAPVDGQGSAARFVFPSGLVVEPSGNVLVCDNRHIRRVTPDGRVTTIAVIPQTDVTTPSAALDNAGRLHVTGFSWVGRFDAFAP